MTDKQERFCQEYMIDLNATQAAIRAGYSVGTAEQIGYQLLQKTSVSNRIAQLRAEQSKRTGISADRVVRELARIGFSQVTDFVEVQAGKVIVKDTETFSPDTIGAIASIKEGKNGIEIKLNDKVKALELLGRNLGMFNKEAEESDTGEVQIIDDL